MSNRATYIMSLPENLKQRCAEVFQQYGDNYLKSITNNNRSKVKAVKAMYSLVDSTISESDMVNKSTCTKGCNYCCHVFVCITSDEALTIFNHCNRNNINIDWDKLISQSQLGENDFIGKPSNTTKCVFLNNSGECDIYDVRPMACRKYYVASNPESCNVETGLKEVSVINNLDVEIMVAAIYNIRENDSLSRQLLKLKL